MGEGAGSSGIGRPPRGEALASRELIERMRSKGREIVIAGEGTDELRLLDFMGANANAGGEESTHIILRGGPRVIEVWEEFLHGTQVRCKINKRTTERTEVVRAEIHVKRFMIRHRRLIGISEGDAAILEALLAGS